MAEVADQLAVAVGAQWEAEARVRRLNDPWPLPVSWAAADADLTDAWGSLVKLASSGAGWPVPPPARTWAAGPDELTGKGGELVEVLAQVPTGRLAVLGEPGAGKTMLMVRLVLDLLAGRGDGGLVPFLASMASWNPAVQDLSGWLVAQLLVDHPALAEPPSADMTEPTQAAALLAAGLILPILDGLDEIPEQVRGAAIREINDALRPGQQVVVTCRSQQYRAAIRPEGGIEVTLRAAAAVQLRPLDANTVRDYLCDDAAGPVAKARWQPVLAVLGTKVPAGQALSTPLMVGLARAIYNPRPGELPGALREPAELCNPALADRAAVESLLFDAFIPAAYRDVLAGRWRAQDVERWLVYLASHLEDTIRSPDLAWWQLPLAIPGLTFAARTAAWVVTLIGYGTGMRTAFRESPRPVRGIRLQAPSRGNVVVAVAAGAGAGVGAGVLLWAAAEIGAGVAAGVAIGVGFGVAAGVADWASVQRNRPLDLSSAASPAAVLAGDRRTGTVLGVAAGVMAGVVAGVLAGVGVGAVTVAGTGQWPEPEPEPEPRPEPRPWWWSGSQSAARPALRFRLGRPMG
jgi:NACHT domain